MRMKIGEISEKYKLQIRPWLGEGLHTRTVAYSSINLDLHRRHGRLDAKLLEIQRLFCSGTSIDLGLNHLCLNVFVADP